jgi:hypothetical protein
MRLFLRGQQTLHTHRFHIPLNGKQRYIELGVLANAYNPSTREAEAEGLQV